MDALMQAATVREYAEMTPYFQLHRSFESEKKSLTGIIEVRLACAVAVPLGVRSRFPRCHVIVSRSP